MKKSRWFALFLKKAVMERMGRIVFAAAAITVATTLSVVLFAVPAGISERLGEELKAYGANLVVVPLNESSYINENELLNIHKGPVDSFFYQLYGQANLDKGVVEIVGVDFSQAKQAAMGWKIHGRWPVHSEEILAGAAIKEIIGGMEKVGLSWEGRKKEFKVAGFLETGGREDKNIFLDIKEAQGILNLHGKVSAVFLRAKRENLETVSKEIERSMPSVKVKTLQEVARAEEIFLKRIQFLMAFVTFVVLCGAIVSVSSTMMTTTIERRREIALMKALGGTRLIIGLFFIAEAVLTGIAGGIAGFPLGVLLSQMIAKSSFGSFISVSAYLFFLSIAVGMMIAIAGSIIPVKGALRLDPAIVLRGE